jgi:cytochrome c553
MTARSLSILFPALVATPLLAAGLGGWATVTVEDLPEHVVAGQPLELTFTVRQHGVTLLKGLKGRVEARFGNREVASPATAGAKAGQYTASITMPEPGNWTITIHSGFGNSTSKLLPMRVVDRTARVAAMAPAERGMTLFVAKGCVTCHTHRNVGADGTVGPDLTERGFQADYLAKFLADPSIRTSTTATARMPDLELKAPEIAALVAFINGEGQTVSSKR